MCCADITAGIGVDFRKSKRPLSTFPYFIKFHSEKYLLVTLNKITNSIVIPVSPWHVPGFPSRKLRDGKIHSC